MRNGRLFYLMGASGTGKDSLLRYLRDQLPPAAPVKLPRRYITRAADAGGEAHIEITPEAFSQRALQGDFAMYWRSHGYSYGIGLEIDEWLGEGLQVVVNGSRHYLEHARHRYPEIQPMLVTASHDTLFERLIQRGRESCEEIKLRLQRAEDLDRQLVHSDLLILSNDGPLWEAGEALLKLILPNYP